MIPKSVARKKELSRPGGFLPEPFPRQPQQKQQHDESAGHPYENHEQLQEYDEQNDGNYTSEQTANDSIPPEISAPSAKHANASLACGPQQRRTPRAIRRMNGGTGSRSNRVALMLAYG